MLNIEKNKGTDDMPRVETKEHDVNPRKDEDMIVKLGNFRLYFQNYYTIISLGNDLATGALYLIGSLTQAFTDADRLGNYLYIFASFFLLMRPIIRIIHNIYLYKENQYRRDILGEKLDDGYYDDSEENGISQNEQKQKEEKATQNTGNKEVKEIKEQEEKEDADKEIEIVSDNKNKEQTKSESK
ncbi:YrhK family protein [Marinilactibacillus psychrotolerans]|uniref:YrhK domain-containing protein n=2 Tax=Marinilactibacillus psychrotolerans TaxID=191770 RepID=A0AAV3WAA6_9LACT|nr:hypothetical protein MPS01_21790 [Marinilactibacillus psychrotolerans]GEQ36671.1 hypothetical protein M132T_21790 [Marinilactibacillus psychrotolerans]